VYRVYFTSRSEKELSKLSPIDIKKVLPKFSQLISPFKSSLDIKKLTNQADFYRLRVGKVRIIFEIDEVKKEVWVRKIGYRGGIYRGL